jgi:transposase-like protein
MRESHEDWLALGRDLIARGLGAPLLVVADGAPGLIKAVEVLSDEVCVVVVIDHVAGPAGPVVTGAA